MSVEVCKVSKLDTCYSEKSYWVTLLLTIFLGMLGAHRFYTGKKATGVLYLFTFGGAGIGWIVDIILVATGAFLDKEGYIIRQPGHGKLEPNFRLQAVEASEKEKLQKTVQNQSAKSTLFSDYVVPGDTEKKQRIPARPSGQDTSCEKHSFSVVVSATEAQKNEAPQYTTSSYSGNFPAKFYSDMRKYNTFLSVFRYHTEHIFYFSCWDTAIYISQHLSLVIWF